MINEKAVRAYLLKTFPGAKEIGIRKLGSGVQGSGFLIEMDTGAGPSSFVIKGLFPSGLGHDYPSDRAGVFLLDHEQFNNLPSHVRAIDVLSELEDGTIKSVGGGREYYLLMEKGEGADYFNDLRSFAEKPGLDGKDKTRIKALAAYLADIHSEKKESRELYWRKLRDTIGHGECLMGVFDTYPEGVISYGDMAEIEKLCIDWRARLKPKTYRLSQVHGDFHPGNIWFKGLSDFILLDRSRGPWGEPADDVTALSINYIFYSLLNHGVITRAYLEGLLLFFEEYLGLSGDREILEVVAPFFAFRCAVIANPLFYPDLTAGSRRSIFSFAKNVLVSERFDPVAANEYCECRTFSG